MPEEQDKIVRRLTYIEKAEQEGQIGTPTTYQIGTEAEYVKYINPNTQQETTVKNYLDNFSSEGSGGNAFNFNNDGSILTSHITQNDPNDPSTKVSTLVESPYKIGPDTEENSYAKLLKDFNELKTEFNNLKNKTFACLSPRFNFSIIQRYNVLIDKDFKTLKITFKNNSHGLGTIKPNVLKNTIIHLTIVNLSNHNDSFLDDNIDITTNYTKTVNLTRVNAGDSIQIKIQSQDTNSVRLGNQDTYYYVHQIKLPTKGTAISQDNTVKFYIKDDQPTLLGGSNRTSNTKLIDYNLIDLFYPVGSIYINTVYIHPQTLFGGSWQRIEGNFLIGALEESKNWWQAPYGQPYRLGQKGGSTLLHRHSHNVSIPGVVTALSKKTKAIKDSGSGTSVLLSTTGVTTATKTATTSQTGSGSSNNLPPYEVVYMWKRTG